MPCYDCSPPFTVLGKLRNLSPSLFARARCNQTPLDASQRTELENLWLQAEREFIAYDEAIAHLEEKIIALENERTTLRGQVSLVKSLMAPIRKFPPEILLHIFKAHGSVNVVESRNSLVPGFKVASVCSHWRTIAMGSTSLWSTISLTVLQNDSWQPHHLSVVEKPLELSANAPLDITITAVDVGGHDVPESAPILRLLCEQADRWKSVGGHCHVAASTVQDALSSVKGHLKCLHAFTFLDTSMTSVKCIEGAPKLRTLKLVDLQLVGTNTAIPWNQIVNLAIWRCPVSQLRQTLATMRNLQTIKIMPTDANDIGERERFTHSNITSLEFLVPDSTSEKRMVSVLDALSLPGLQSLCIRAFNYRTNQGKQRWSSDQLPCLISRSSAPINTFELGSTWVPTSDLVALLRSMPTLTILSITEPSNTDADSKPMINDGLLFCIHCNHNRQPLLPRLVSLTLDAKHASFSMITFVEMIHSRWKPLYLVDGDVACIKTVRLTVYDTTVAFPGVRSLLMLRKRGLDILIEDKDGDVFYGTDREG